MIDFLVGWLLLILAALVVWHLWYGTGDPVDRAFESSPREPVDDVDIARIDQLFADITVELPDLRERHAQLSAYYLKPGKEDQR